MSVIIIRPAMPSDAPQMIEWYKQSLVVDSVSRIRSILFSSQNAKTFVAGAAVSSGIAFGLGKLLSKCKISDRAGDLRICAAAAAILFAGFCASLWQMPKAIFKNMFESGKLELRTLPKPSQGSGFIAELISEDADPRPLGMILVKRIESGEGGTMTSEQRQMREKLGWHASSDAEVSKIFIAPEGRGKGILTKLFDASLDWATAQNRAVEEGSFTAAPVKRLVFVTSSAANYEAVLKVARRMGFRSDELAIPSVLLRGASMFPCTLSLW